MSLIASDAQIPNDIAAILASCEHPAIAMAPDYSILASNQLYINHFGAIDNEHQAKCYQVSHGYNEPCDQAGEDCPLANAKATGEKANVLHIHQTPRGKEYVDVELTPIYLQGELAFFIEQLKPVALADVTEQKLATDEQPLVGTSSAFSKMLASISKVAGCSASVLLLGESGVGKELAAQTIHRLSARKDKPLVTLECAGLTDTLFESELFGHVKGAFTGAQNAKKGLIEQADGGTLFLDEIGDVPLSMQVKLLRLLETGTFRRVGSATVQHANFRLVCATHVNIKNLVNQGQFRQDLYYRINVFPIRIPPLRERKDDIASIAEALVGRMKTKRKMHFTQGATKRLQAHNFPGNIRELRNILARAVVLSQTNIIDANLIDDAFNIDFEPTPQNKETNQETSQDWVDLKTAEINYLRAMLEANKGDKQKTADIAGISLRSLYRKLGINND